MFCHFHIFHKKNSNLAGKKMCILVILLSVMKLLIFAQKKLIFFLEFDKVWVHGFLHLLGYDHIKNKDYFRMNKIEKIILNLIA